MVTYHSKRGGPASCTPPWVTPSPPSSVPPRSSQVASAIRVPFRIISQSRLVPSQQVSLISSHLTSPVASCFVSCRLVSWWGHIVVLLFPLPLPLPPGHLLVLALALSHLSRARVSPPPPPTAHTTHGARDIDTVVPYEDPSPIPLSSLDPISDGVKSVSSNQYVKLQLQLQLRVASSKFQPRVSDRGVRLALMRRCDAATLRRCDGSSLLPSGVRAVCGGWKGSDCGDGCW